jgi:signal transduction histidine kinase/CheY-like chemotaxis protein
MDEINNFIFLIPEKSLKAALLVSFFSTWVLIGIFFYLNHYTRRRYFTIWAGGWLFYSIWLILSYYAQEWGESNLLLMLRLWCVSATATLFFWGSTRFLGYRFSQRLVALFVMFLITWSFVGAFFLDEYFQVRMPVYTLISLASVWISWGFFVYRRRHHFIGAGLLSAGFLLWAIYHIVYPAFQRSDAMYSIGYFMSAIIQLYIAIAMIVLVLEEARDVKNRILTEAIEKQREATFLKKMIDISEERYRVLFKQATEGLIIVDAENLKILDIDRAAAKILDIPNAEEAKKHCLSEFCYVDEKVAPTLKNGEDWINYFYRQRPIYLKQNKIMAVEFYCSVVSLGPKRAYQIFVRELTEQDRFEQQIRQAGRLAALGQMVSNVSHELNNPLSVIKGYLEIILRRHPLEQQTRIDLEKIEKECDRAANLIKNFLTFARNRTLQQKPVNLNEILKDVMELCKFSTRISNVDVKYELSDIPVTMADPEQIKQVVIILVNNALQAMEKSMPPHLLILKTNIANNLIKVEIQDNGPGVPPHLEEKIFEPFFTTKEISAGTGLGLSIAYNIITEHNGRIYYKRPAVGGACFVFELPIVKPPVEVSLPTKEPESQIIQASYPAKVLVVDDQYSVTEMLGEILRLIGYVPSICNSVIDAFAMLEQNEFDVILSDIKMPVIDGMEFYERLKKQRPEYLKRLVFLSGDTMSEETQEILKSTGNFHLQKPFTMAAVQNLIEKVLKHSGVHQSEDKQG